MTKEEAIEWIKGTKDMGGLITQVPYETWNVRTEQANAAKLQQAYYVLKSYKEGLLNDT